MLPKIALCYISRHKSHTGIQGYILWSTRKICPPLNFLLKFIPAFVDFFLVVTRAYTKHEKGWFLSLYLLYYYSLLFITLFLAFSLLFSFLFSFSPITPSKFYLFLSLSNGIIARVYFPKYYRIYDI